MARTEALKQAQRRYRLKLQQQNKGRSEALKASQKKYRRKIQVTDEYKQKEAKRQRELYHKNRNYKYLDNMASSFKLLFGNEYYNATY